MWAVPIMEPYPKPVKFTIHFNYKYYRKLMTKFKIHIYFFFKHKPLSGDK